MKSNKISFNYLIVALLMSLFIFSCKKDSSNTIIHETGTMTDIDGNVYQTVKIGNQWWMAENLKVKTFRNGNPILDGQFDILWKDSIAAFCLYDNNANSPGLLYNWFAVNDTNNLAPEGWHIPTDDEWKELEKSLGMDTDETNKSGWRGTKEAELLKVNSPEGWNTYEDLWSTNEFGFSAIAGGCRLNTAVWADPGLFATGFWWSSTFHADGEAWYRYLDYKNTRVFRSHCLKGYGCSIRCVKNVN